MKEKIKKIPVKYWIAIGVFLIISVLMVKHRNVFYESRQDNYNDRSGENDVIPAEETIVTQYFEIKESVQSIALLMTNDSGQNVVIDAGLYNADTNELLASAQTDLPDSRGEESVISFSFSSGEVSGKQKVYLMLQEETPVDEVNYCVLKGDYESDMTVNNQESGTSLRMSVIYGGGLNLTFFVLFGLGAAVVVGICVLPKRLERPEYIFVILATVMGIAMAVINPPFQECDGPSHFYKAMDVSYGNILGSFGNFSHGDGVINVPENVSDISYRQITPNGSEGSEYVNYLKTHKFSNVKVEMTYYESVTSIVYWPQGLGIFIGRALNLSIYGVILMGRLFNLLTYVMLGFFAIRFIPCYKNLLAMLAVMPLSIYQAASLSQDAVLNGFGFLFIALCLYYAFDENVKLSWKHTLLLGFLLLGMFLCKYVYACMGLLVFLIPKNKFESNRKYWKAFAITLIPFAILCIYIMSRVSTGISGLQAVGGASSDMTQLQYLMANPLAGVKVIFSTVLVQTNEYLQQLNILGSLNYPLSMLMIIVPCFLTTVGMLDGQSMDGKIKVRQRVLLIVTFIITAVAVMLGLYIADGYANPVGAAVVRGVQGRYFIILIVLPFIALVSDKIKHNINHFTIKVSAIMGIMLLYALFILIKTCY